MQSPLALRLQRVCVNSMRSLTLKNSEPDYARNDQSKYTCNIFINK
jgi:hypothetical protein